MTELLSYFKPGEIIALVAVVGGLMIPLTAIVGGYWYHGRLTAFKQDMVNRGMSVSEIEAVMQAGNRRHHATRPRHPCRC